jgi:hypothetical protein
MRKLTVSAGLPLDSLVAGPARHGAGGCVRPPEDPALKECKRSRSSQDELNAKEVR